MLNEYLIFLYSWFRHFRWDPFLFLPNMYLFCIFSIEVFFPFFCNFNLNVGNEFEIKLVFVWHNTLRTHIFFSIVFLAVFFFSIARDVNWKEYIQHTYTCYIELTNSHIVTKRITIRQLKENVKKNYSVKRQWWIWKKKC